MRHPKNCGISLLILRGGRLEAFSFVEEITLVHLKRAHCAESHLSNLVPLFSIGH
jgi:hypothetical protein